MTCSSERYWPAVFTNLPNYSKPAVVDASHTARLALSPLGAFTYLSASGNRYEPGTPVPAAGLSLMTTSGIFLALLTASRAAAARRASPGDPD
jgi:hypothetical protein